MYGKLGALLPATAATLPFTGLDLGWMLMAGFVLLMAGVAALTILPRRTAAVRKVNSR